MNTAIFTFEDDLLGTVTVRCNPRARRVILRLSGRGDVVVTIPRRSYLKVAKELLAANRNKLIARRKEPTLYQPNQQIGHDHELVFRARPVDEVTARVTSEQIIITYPITQDISERVVQDASHDAVKKALRQQAKKYLTKRTQQLAEQHNFTFSELRITSGKTRWGSCSSSKTINLNLWLMTLPDHLADYVICHELCHTVHHNHGQDFWQLMTRCMPESKRHRKELHKHHPF